MRTFSAPFSSSSSIRLPTREETKRRSLNPRASSTPIPRKEDVVIIGADIAGLTTALSLHRYFPLPISSRLHRNNWISINFRLGVRSLVLEQGDSLRTGGTSLTLFKNGWRVLDAIGVGDKLRDKFLLIHGLVMRSMDGRELRSFSFEKEAPRQEVRAVERSLLLETLSSRLLPNSIAFSSKVKSSCPRTPPPGRSTTFSFISAPHKEYSCRFMKFHPN
ncbi:hypothetical protein KSP39_PZI014368 [Platanthera zijinensis]|uniref:Uncharacterized protein n=1 Tax=Platanthera zijinensis TaxID=2320716 RepID=A0AAP0B9S0_9ASPA